MSIKDVITLDPIETINNMVQEKGISQELLDLAIKDGHVGNFLEGIKTGMIWLAPPKGGEVYFLTTSVRPSRPWQERIMAAGPDTQDSNPLYTIEHLFPVTADQTFVGNYVLVRFSDTDDVYNRAQEWAKAARVSETHPIEMFAIAENFPNLRPYGRDCIFQWREDMSIVATQAANTHGKLSVCFVTWLNKLRRAGINWTRILDLATTWFIYRR